jgi:hypothetical protein
MQYRVSVIVTMNLRQIDAPFTQPDGIFFRQTTTLQWLIVSSQVVTVSSKIDVAVAVSTVTPRISKV